MFQKMQEDKSFFSSNSKAIACPAQCWSGEVDIDPGPLNAVTLNWGFLGEFGFGVKMEDLLKRKLMGWIDLQFNFLFEGLGYSLY